MVPLNIYVCAAFFKLCGIAAMPALDPSLHSYLLKPTFVNNNTVISEMYSLMYFDVKWKFHFHFFAFPVNFCLMVKLSVINNAPDLRLSNRHYLKDIFPNLDSPFKKSNSFTITTLEQFALHRGAKLNVITF